MTASPPVVFHRDPVAPRTDYLSRDIAAGSRMQDYRGSVANVWRRRDRGDTPLTCAVCGTETDVESPAHDTRCPA